MVAAQQERRRDGDRTPRGASLRRGAGMRREPRGLEKGAGGGQSKARRDIKKREEGREECRER